MAAAVGMRFGRYELLERIGAGGMGEVFRARDRELQREVAIKFLLGAAARDEGRLARFALEARAASALNHPSIVTIHDIGSAQGRPYIVMELVRGDTLRATIGRGPVPPRLALDIACQLADGLAKAHAARIVHRDLKPENVIVTADGFAKILDFGLAKLAVEQPVTPDSRTLSLAQTLDGVVLGTVGYMSPEQASGRAVDHRADQFALGAIVHEMATGVRAFRGESLLQILDAIVHDDPAPLAQANPEFPRAARRVVERCLAKDPAGRYDSTLDLARELRAARDDHLAGGRDGNSRAPLGRRPWLLFAAILAALAIVGIFPVVYRGEPPLPADKRVAFLQAGSSAGATAGETEGLLDYVVARVGELERFHTALWVVPAAEVRQSGISLPTAARRALGATLVVNLSVQKAGAESVVIAGLIDTEQGRQLRAATRRVPADGALLDSAVDAVVGLLDLELASAERAALRAGTTPVADASALYAQGLARTPYQQGRTALERYEQQQSLERAVDAFNRALEKDPAYALAHAGAGEAYLRLYRLTKRTEYVELAEQHCRRALQGDSLIGGAWLTLGMLHVQTGKPEEALKDFERALDRAPRSAEVYREQAAAYAALRRPADAEASFRKAVSLRPDSWATYSYLGTFLAAGGRHKEAEAAFQRALALAPDNARTWSNLGAVYYLQDRHAEAEDAWRKSVALHPTATTYSNIGTRKFYTGKYAAAARIFEQAARLNGRDCRIWRNLAAAYYWAPGERLRAEKAFRRAIELGKEELKLGARDARLLAEIADCQANLGEKAQARASLNAALKLAPEDVQVLTIGASAYDTLGERDLALRLLESSLRRGYPLSEIESNPAFDALRKDPRFRGK
jgi:serine/threonine-protein kinase